MRQEFSAVLAALLKSKLSGSDGGGQPEIQNRSVSVDKDSYIYQVYTPKNAESGQNLPLLVFLHGIRERGAGGFVPTEGVTGALVRQYMAKIPAIVLLPQCRPGSFWSDPSMERMVLRAIEQTSEEFGADLNRLSLVGVSMGGYGVWHFAAQHPERFAALVSICGGSPLLSGERFSPIARKVGNTPVWLFHGADDSVVPVGESRGLAAALKANGAAVKYNEYPGVGHNVWFNVLAEKGLLPWLLAQRRGANPV